MQADVWVYKYGLSDSHRYERGGKVSGQFAPKNEILLKTQLGQPAVQAIVTELLP